MWKRNISISSRSINPLVSEELNSVETSPVTYSSELDKEVSEELNSVETEGSLEPGEDKTKFQKNLIVWKLNQEWI